MKSKIKANFCFERTCCAATRPIPRSWPPIFPFGHPVDVTSGIFAQFESDCVFPPL